MIGAAVAAAETLAAAGGLVGRWFGSAEGAIAAAAPYDLVPAGA